MSANNFYVYRQCTPGMSKSPRQLPNYLKRAEISVDLIVFAGVFCEVYAYTVTVFYRRST
jgi:hypothetical protein